MPKSFTIFATENVTGSPRTEDRQGWKHHLVPLWSHSFFWLSWGFNQLLAPLDDRLKSSQASDSQSFQGDRSIFEHILYCNTYELILDKSQYVCVMYTVSCNSICWLKLKWMPWICRYFYATLQLGSPARSFAVIVDTGSTITYVPCASCGSNCGPHHKVTSYNPCPNKLRKCHTEYPNVSAPNLQGISDPKIPYNLQCLYAP